MGNSMFCIHRDCPGSKRTLQICLSEKEYIPMTLDMKKALLEGRKFRHTLPSRETTKNVDSGKPEKKMDGKQPPEKAVISDKTSKVIMFKDEVQEMEMSLVETEDMDEEILKNTKQQSVTHRSDTSLIDSGVKKSKFTLKLEEKLRQSKLELGFDADLDDWKEFTYIWEDSHEKRKEFNQNERENTKKEMISKPSVSRTVLGSDVNLNSAGYPSSKTISKRLGSDLMEETVSKHFSITTLPKDWARRHLSINTGDSSESKIESLHKHLDEIYQKHLNRPQGSSGSKNPSLISKESKIVCNTYPDSNSCSFRNQPIEKTSTRDNHSPRQCSNNVSNYSGKTFSGKSACCILEKLPPDKASANVSFNNSTPKYCAHNCQILGLCSVSKPTCVSFEPSVFKEEMSRKYDVKNLLKGEVGKHSKEGCSCDLCTLAFLTEMGFSEEGDRRAENRFLEEMKNSSGSSTCSRIGSGDLHREKIRILEKGARFRSLEVSVSTKHSIDDSSCKLSGGTSSKSDMSTDTVLQDVTNLKIRRMFKKNKLPSFKNVYSPNKSSDVSVVNHSTGRNTVESTRYMPDVPSTGATASFRHETRKSSSSILDASISSSLSTVMSYRRVRKIFQSIIEKNRSRKRVRKNIHKFKEMEELGLGELKNNRWYPSECKTFSIWSNMHSNMKGVQAEFKKYPKK